MIYDVMPIIEAHGTPTDLALVGATLNMALYMMGQVQESLNVAVSIAQRIPDSNEWSILLKDNSYRYFELGLYKEAIETADAPHNLPFSRSRLIGMSLYYMGRIEEARPYLQNALAGYTDWSLTSIPNYWRRIHVRSFVMILNLMLGNLEQTRMCLQEILLLVDTGHNLYAVYQVLEYSIDWWIAVNQYEIAIEIYACVMQVEDAIGGLAKFRAKKHHTELETSVSPEVFASAWERGSQYTLDEIVDRLLDALDSKE